MDPLLTSSGIPHWWKTDWLDQAACLGEDPELFFPPSTADPHLEQIKATGMHKAKGLFEQAAKEVVPVRHTIRVEILK